MKRIFTVVLVSLITAIIFNILIDPLSFFNNIIATLEVWLYKVYPSIFTFYLIAALLVNTNIINRFVYYCRFFFRKLKFRNENCLNLFLISIFTGNPASASLIGEAFHNQKITLTEANQLLKTSSFLNPLFILSYLAVFNIKYATIMIFVHIAANFIVTVYENRNNNPTAIEKRPINFALSDFFSSLNRAVGILLMISAVMVVAGIINYSVTNILKLYGDIPIAIRVLLANIEISIGLNNILSLQLPLPSTLLLFAFLTGFSGLSIHFQVYNIISKYKMNFFLFFKYRILHGIISIILLIPFLLLNK